MRRWFPRRALRWTRPATSILSKSATIAFRKINTAGIINTIAGTGAAGYTGDGGPGVKATLSLPQGVAVDGAGNVYFADNTFYVRKIDTSGNISTFAGNGQAINLGSSGPATSIGMVPTWVAADAAGNVFINDTARVWRVAAGTATTIAGGPLNFNLGDGGPATSASLVSNGSIAVDTAGTCISAMGGTIAYARYSEWQRQAAAILRARRALRPTAS